jgi:hypothetical protein
MTHQRAGFWFAAALAFNGLGACGSSGGAAAGSGGAGGAPGSGGAGPVDAPADLAGGDVAVAADDQSVLQRNKHATRDGHYVQPLLTRSAAAKLVLDASFKPTITGTVYAQPLYVASGPGGKGMFIVATEDNNVHAVAEADGAPIWTMNLGTPAKGTGAGCGNISPYGITGTPVIDLSARTIYVASGTGNDTMIMQQRIHALSIDDGSPRAGFPFDPATVGYNGMTFVPYLHNQRAALLLLDGVVYVPYGGHAGDCGDYRGWVMGIPVANPAGAKAFATGARGGGIWAAGGLASDGTHVFTATGNTFGTTTWAQGEAIIRLQAGPIFSGQPDDYFVPSDWLALDGADQDLGGTGPILVDVPGATPSALVVALGKNGVAYLLDRNRLGGMGTGDGLVGEGLASAPVTHGPIINAPTTYTTAGGTYVVFRVANNQSGIGCPAGQTGDLVAIKIGAAAPPTISVAWCADNQGQGSPMVTTVDGKAEAVVWSVGAEGSKRLHGFNGDTGAVVYAGGGDGDLIPNQVRRFNSPIAVNGRIIIAADNALYAFKTP